MATHSNPKPPVLIQSCRLLSTGYYQKAVLVTTIFLRNNPNRNNFRLFAFSGFDITGPDDFFFSIIRFPFLKVSRHELRAPAAVMAVAGGAGHASTSFRFHLLTAAFSFHLIRCRRGLSTLFG